MLTEFSSAWIKSCFLLSVCNFIKIMQNVVTLESLLYNEVGNDRVRSKFNFC